MDMKRYDPTELKDAVNFMTLELKNDVSRIGKDGRFAGVHYKVMLEVLNDAIHEPAEVEKEFSALCRKWRAETGGVSSATELILHPAYQAIIGLGMPVVPFILQEISRGRGHWDWALRAITRKDPVPEEARCESDKIAEAWLNWGREQGLIPQ